MIFDWILGGKQCWKDICGTTENICIRILLDNCSNAKYIGCDHCFCFCFFCGYIGGCPYS